MAKPVDGAKSDRLKDLEREITCPLCLETFEDPRMLPCQHIYCKSCLDLLASQNGNVSITCPECRKETALVGGRVADLPVAFQINRLKELVPNLDSKDEINGPNTARPIIQEEGEDEYNSHSLLTLMFLNQLQTEARHDEGPATVADNDDVDDGEGTDAASNNHHHDESRVTANRSNDLRQKFFEELSAAICTPIKKL